MAKKALMLASVASMIEQFNMNNIDILLGKGYEVDVVCNCKTGNTISDDKIQKLMSLLSGKGVNVIHIPIPRKISDIKSIFVSVKKVKELFRERHYSLMHCHSPIGGAVARVAAKKYRKYGTKVIYTAHGFHFYKGAPKKNWVLFYPIEKILSRVTDVLITINKEDYEFALRKMCAPKIEYIPGIGVNTEKFKLENFDKSNKRKELNVNEEANIILSVGELNDNKNHETIIRALAKLKNPNNHYFIAGIGEKKEFLIEYAKRLGVNLHILGFRTDIVELLNIADIFVFPSYREGLSVALMEAMSAGLPCIVSDIRGNTDLIDNGVGGYLCEPSDSDSFSKQLGNLIDNEQERLKFGLFNQEKIKGFDSKICDRKMSDIYF